MGSRTVDGALRQIRTLLPEAWSVSSEMFPECREQGVDGQITLRTPSGEQANFAFVEISRAASVRLFTPFSVVASKPVIVVSDYIPPRLRSELSASGLGYADATGWVSLVSECPLVLLTGRGAKRGPQKEGSTAVARLSGVAVNRIIRALCAVTTPIGVRELASVAGVSPGSVSKLLPTLVAEGVVDQPERGPVENVHCRDLIRRWVQDYSFMRTNKSVGFFISPRGVKYAKEQINEGSASATLTGSSAARLLLPEGVTPVVPERLLSLYASAPDVLADQLGLIPADPGTANVVIAVPQAPEILADPIAPTALVLADLLTLPGRGDAEAEQLMDVLAASDQRWETSGNS